MWAKNLPSLPLTTRAGLLAVTVLAVTSEPRTIAPEPAAEPAVTIVAITDFAASSLTNDAFVSRVPTPDAPSARASATPLATKFVPDMGMYHTRVALGQIATSRPLVPPASTLTRERAANTCGVPGSAGRFKSDWYGL